MSGKVYAMLLVPKQIENCSKLTSLNRVIVLGMTPLGSQYKSIKIA